MSSYYRDGNETIIKDTAVMHLVLVAISMVLDHLQRIVSYLLIKEITIIFILKLQRLRKIFTIHRLEGDQQTIIENTFSNCLSNNEGFCSDYNNTAFPPIYSQYRSTENKKISTESLQSNDKMSGVKIKYVPNNNNHRTANNPPILREKMPDNDLDQPFEDFFYEKLKASEENTITKKKLPANNQEIQNDQKTPESKKIVSIRSDDEDAEDDSVEDDDDFIE
uniref:Uncharacterized protein n=1 Tax=Megaselia scalaris TaxID=36166 RepID=T1GNY1_MEGSC